mgnify:CR=1 FL=1
MTNWKALQVPVDKTTKEALIPYGILPRYMAMGSFHADAHHDGQSRKKYKCTRDFGREKK